MPRQVVPLIYGTGLDRATGILAADAKAGRDLRNVYLYKNKVQIRRGHSTVNTLLDESGVPLQDVLLVQAMQAQQVGVVAGFGNDGRVHLFQVAGDGSALVPIGIAFTLTNGAHSPPRLLAAEQYSKLFIAQDEPLRTKRAATVYYDPFGSVALNTLMANLDGAGSNPVLFRGVAPYLNYLVGWGFGSHNDPDHPEIVRVSHPDDPTKLDPDDYFRAGQGGSAVLNCLGVGSADASALLVLKPSETHQIFGYDKRTFGIRLVDSYYGVAASRLAISINGVAYIWSIEGPRKSTGGPSIDLAWPLDLDAPSPHDLATMGALADGFACYLPGRRCILFIFGQRVYSLSLWDPSGTPKWSYTELGFQAQSAGLLYSGGEPLVPPNTSAPSAVVGVSRCHDVGGAPEYITFQPTWTDTVPSQWEIFFAGSSLFDGNFPIPAPPPIFGDQVGAVAVSGVTGKSAGNLLGYHGNPLDPGNRYKYAWYVRRKLPNVGAWFGFYTASGQFGANTAQNADNSEIPDLGAC